MTACARYEDNLALYVEGDLPAGDAHAVEAHLEGCAGCRDFLVELRASQDVVKELAAEPMDDRSLAFVRTRVASRRAYRPFRLRARHWAIAASLVAAAATTLWLAKASMRAPGAGVETASQPKAAPGPEPQSEPPRIAAPRLPEPRPEPKRSRVTAPSRTFSPRTQPDRTFGLSPEDADQLARAVVAVSRIERVTEAADPAGLTLEPTGYVQVATADPNVAIFWRLETNGEEQ